MTKIAFFDLEGTLVKGDTAWTLVKDKFGVPKEVDQEYQQLYDQGKIGFEEWRRKLAEIWRENKVKLKDFNELLKNYELVEGAKELIQELKKKDFKIAFITGAISLFADMVGKDLGADSVFSAHEFVFDEDIDSREQINSIIDYFVESGFLTRSIENGGFKITKRGFDRLPIWAALTKTFLESYWIVVKSMSQQKSKEGKTGDLLKKMNYLGKRFHKLGVIDHIGALSSLNYKNALNFINKEILSNHDNPDEENVSPHDRLAQFGQRLYELSHYGQ